MAYESSSTNQYLTVNGTIDGKDVTMRCWLTEDGEIHGRYRHENGTTLDANGYLKSDKPLYPARPRLREVRLESLARRQRTLRHVPLRRLLGPQK